MGGDGAAVLAVVPWVGMSSGLCVAALGIALWSSGQRERVQQLRTVRALEWIGWAVTLMLIIAAWELWSLQHDLTISTLRWVLIGALAAPLDRALLRREPSIGVWVLFSTTLVVVGALLSISFCLPTSSSGEWDGLLPLPVVLFGGCVCGGLAVRLLGETLAAYMSRGLPERWTFPVAYACLALLAGGIVLAGTYVRGIPWPQSRFERGLVAAWVGWSGLWIGRGLKSRIHDALMIAAALALVSVVVAA